MTASDAEMPPAVEPAVLANGAGDAPAPAVTAKDARAPPRRGRGREDRARRGGGSRRRRARGGGRAARLDARAPRGRPQGVGEGRSRLRARHLRPHVPPRGCHRRAPRGAFGRLSRRRSLSRVVLRAVRGLRQAPGRVAPRLRARAVHVRGGGGAVRREAGRVFPARGRRHAARLGAEAHAQPEAPVQRDQQRGGRRGGPRADGPEAGEGTRRAHKGEERQGDRVREARGGRLVLLAVPARLARRRERRRERIDARRIDGRRTIAIDPARRLPPTWSATSFSCASGA